MEISRNWNSLIGINRMRNRMEINFESLCISLFRIFFSFFFFFHFHPPVFFFFFSFFSRREAIKIAWPWVKRHAAEFRSEPDLIRVAITNAVIANSAWKRASTRSVRYFLIVRLINEQKIAGVSSFMGKGRSGGLCAWPRFSRSKIQCRRVQFDFVTYYSR